jgi:phospholipase D-like protein
MTKRSWGDLSPLARKFIFAAGLVQVGLLIAAQIDLAKRPREQVAGSKARWRIISLLNFIGPLLYFWRGRRKPTTA